MKTNIFYTCFLLSLLMLFSCSPVRKSATYYQENKIAISELRNYFNLLYKQQPFSAGFTDNTLKYYVMQVSTDTLRSVYNTEKRKDELYQNISRFHYDTSMLIKMTDKMREIKCLWVGKIEYYFGEHKECFEYISFKSSDEAFRENKYHLLVFLDHTIADPKVYEQFGKASLVKVDSLVYYTTMNRLR